MARALSNEELRIGVFVCSCGSNIEGVVDVKEVASYARTLPDVVVVQQNKYSCSEPGQQEIKKKIIENKLNRVVVASCSPKLHEPTFRQVCADSGVNPYLFEMANIREQASWVHSKDPIGATKRARDAVRIAIAKARHLNPQYELEVPVERATLVIGGGVAGIQASLDLADTGYKVYLVEKEPTIGGIMASLDKTYPTMDCSI